MSNALRDYITLSMRGLTCKLPDRVAINVDPDPTQLGLRVSPQKETNKNIVFQAKDSKIITTEQEIEDLMKELIDNHTFGLGSRYFGF